jgi:hypothetical protein
VAAAESAPTGTRRMIPLGRTISAVGSGITRTAANDGLGVGEAGGCADPSRRASARRSAKEVDSPSPRAAQNAVTDCPDAFRAATVSRQNWSPRRRLDFGTGWVPSWVRKTQSYPTPQGVPGPDAYGFTPDPAVAGTYGVRER